MHKLDDSSLLKSMRITSKVPPNITSISEVASSISCIWVLDETLELYRKHPVWSYFSPIIFPLSLRTPERIGFLSFLIGKWDFEIDKYVWE